MNIRFTSSLTPEDENTVAPAILNALGSILDLLPIAYVIRVDTTDAKVYQHSGPLGHPAAEQVPEPIHARRVSLMAKN